MTTQLFRTLAAATVFLTATTAHSGALYCNGGTVATLAYHQPGTLYLRLSNMNTPVAICSTDTNFAPAGSLAGVTTPAACKTIYATLLAAKHAGTVITQMLFDGDQVPASCTGFAPWSQVNIRFIDH